MSINNYLASDRLQQSTKISYGLLRVPALTSPPCDRFLMVVGAGIKILSNVSHYLIKLSAR
ncbi:hypothetical protein [Fischerella sp. JS2]|uniref:hypothetical protein n=1 Tax=Fischerella sp. JS2 TaxID=2597771 RepID=UPI0028E889EC|nr:hypothetical protein [Fischerella sp. JS2]